MGNWDNRGFWQITWKSGTHTLNSSNALMTLKTFLSGGDEPQEQDVTDNFIVNASFDSNISGWTNTGGTAQWKQNTWAPLSNYCEFAWTGNAIVDQEVVQTPTLQRVLTDLPSTVPQIMVQRVSSSLQGIKARK